MQSESLLFAPTEHWALDAYAPAILLLRAVAPLAEAHSSSSELQHEPVLPILQVEVRETALNVAWPEL